MKRHSPIRAVLLVITLTALAFASTLSEAEDRRIRTLIYEPTQVYRLRGWIGYHVDVEFEPGETFSTLGGGDLGALSYGAFENHLVLKPTASNIRTNLTVITSRRTYVFDYVVDGGVPDPSTDDLVYSLRFTYSLTSNSSGVGTPVDTVAKDLKGAEATRVRNYDYWFCGDVSLRPVEASDDGVHTRLRFAPRAEIPAFFIRSDDGSESLLNFSVDIETGDVVVHRTARRLILRRGRLTGCVVNRSYFGASERMETGTVSPAVKRDMSGVRP